ncbi:response regulator transcription factor [Castellaniella sp. GW247-6E4]|uniref:response regulator transcription factor n=1 Tax=Castellaniella sp. GW247-6E4 TaxID=3140380 RepID=UPI0033153618
MNSPATPHADSIAVLEDDAIQAEWVRQILSEAGFTCQLFSEGNTLLAALRNRASFDLLLLDWELPGIDGIEVLQWIRANRGQSIPVIFVTNRTHEEDIVKGLNAGADDYIGKPPRPAELLARIGSLLRRNGQATPLESDFMLGDFTVEVATRQIRLRGAAISLTPKEFDLAALFLRNPWRLFSRDDLSALVWNREVPSTSRTLDTHLSNIRKKLQLGPACGALLSASYALGYRLELLSTPQSDP